MNLVWRLIRTQVKPHLTGLLIRVAIALVVASAPYAFSFLGKWLLDEALQVAGPPKAQASAEAGQDAPAGKTSLTVEWKAKTTEEKLHLLAIFVAVSVGIHVAVTLLSMVSELLNANMVHRMTFALRTRIHEKIEGMDIGYFEREKVGELMTRVLDDAGGIPANLINLVVNSCTQVGMLILGTVLLFRLNAGMTLFVLAALPFYAVTCCFFLPRIRKNAEEIRSRGAAFTGHVIERLSSVATIKNYAQEEREVSEFGRILAGNQALSRSQQGLNLYFTTLTTLITSAATLAVLAFGFVNIKAQRMQIGEVLAFYQVTAQLFVPISALIGMAAVLQTLQILALRIYTILDTPAGLMDAPDAVDPAEIKGDIAFEHVSLRYEEGGPFAVKDINLSIPAGAPVCIVGPTGCGKSTLIALLTRLYDPTEGVIRLDGQDIRKIRVKRLRHAIGNVLHDCQVFTGTIAENISYGAPDAAREEVERAAKLVELHEFIMEQPKGYDAPVGTGGIALPPEELVKLGIARALVTGPAVLTVDDTYAGMEETAERRIRAAVRGALSDKTILIATSRLSICEDADMIVVMQRGKAVQVGRHEDLLAVPGLYRRMYMRDKGLKAVEEAGGRGNNV